MSQEKQLELPQIDTTANDTETVHSESTTSISHSTTLTASTALQNKESHRINPQKWHGLFRGYVRQDWHTINVSGGIDELRAEWVELFYDLIYVACIVHISAQAAASLSWPDDDDDTDSHRRLASSTSYIGEGCDDDGRYDYLFTVFAQFGLLLVFWLEQVMYQTHFVFNQWIDEVISVLYMCMVLSMGMFIQNDPTYHAGFLSSYAMLRFFSLFMYLKALLIPRAKWHAIWFLVQHSITCLALIILISVYKGHGCALDYFGIYLCFFIWEKVADISHWIVSSKCNPSTALPMNVPHISERYGLFVMIILGESLISIMTTNLGQLDLDQKFVYVEGEVPPDIMVVFFFLLAFVMSYNIGRLYYNCQPSEEQILRGMDNHALRISKERGRIYMFAHQALFFGLLGYGMGIKIAAKHVLDVERKWIDVVLPGYSLVVIVICLNFIRIAHPFDAHRKIWIYRVLILIVMIIMPSLAKTINQAAIFLVSLVCVFGLVIVDVEGRAKIKHEKQEAKEKRDLAQMEHAVRSGDDSRDDRFKYFTKNKSAVGLM